MGSEKNRHHSFGGHNAVDFTKYTLEEYMKKVKSEIEDRWKEHIAPNAAITDFTVIKLLGEGSFG
jgi:hypothetical protein